MGDSSGGGWGDPGGRGQLTPRNPGALDIFRDNSIMLLMKNRGQDTLLTNARTRDIYRYISQVIPNLQFCKRLQDGNFLMKIDKNKKKEIMSISKIEIAKKEIPVCIVEAGNMNNTKVTIKHFSIKQYNNKDLLEDLQMKNEGILAVEIQTDWDKVRRIESNSEFAVVTLEGKFYKNELQHMRIELWWEKLRVQLHIPQPNRCKNCFSFDHYTSKKRPCTQPKICGRCGKPPTEHKDKDGNLVDECNQEQLCINCIETDHPAWSNKCKRYKEEQNIIKKMTEERISYRTAKYLIKKREDEKRESMSRQVLAEPIRQNNATLDNTNDAVSARLNSEVTQVLYKLEKMISVIVQALKIKVDTDNDIFNVTQDDMTPDYLSEEIYSSRLTSMQQNSSGLSVLKNTLELYGDDEGGDMVGVEEVRSANKRVSRGDEDAGGPGPPLPKRHQVSRRNHEGGGPAESVAAGRGNHNPPARHESNRGSRRSSSSSQTTVRS